MMTPNTADFASFWPRYVAAHACDGCRWMHYAGTLTGSTLLVVGLVWGPLWWIAVGVLVGYGCAWFGHGVLAGNRPETFGHPFYAFVADFKMLGLALRGRMGAELARHGGD